MTTYLEHATMTTVVDANGISWSIGQPVIPKGAGGISRDSNTATDAQDIDPDDASTYELRDVRKWVGIINQMAYGWATGSVLVEAYTDIDHGQDTSFGVYTVTEGIKDWASEHAATAKIPGPLRLDTPPNGPLPARSSSGGGLWLLLGIAAWYAHEEGWF